MQAKNKLVAIMVALCSGLVSAAPVALEMNRGKPGEAKPLGWLKAWSRLAADGYACCMDEVDPEFARAWAAEFRPVGGKLDWMAAPNGSWSAEGGAYWFDGLVRLAEQLDDSRLRDLAKKRLEPILANMHAKSVLFNWWLDRDRDEERGWCYKSPAVWQMWAAGISERAFAAYLDVTGDVRAKRALVFAFDDPRLFTEAAVRKAPAAQAVFEAAWLTGDAGVGRTADVAARDPMPAFSVPPMADLAASLDWKRPEIRRARATRHGVTTAEALLSVLRAYRWSGERKYLNAVLAWFAFLDRHALQPYGVTVSDEEWGWAGASRGSETCAVAAEPWTRTELMMLLGDGSWGDAVERAFFNAAPNCVSRDFRRHVYLQTANRTDAKDFHAVSAYRDFVDLKECPTCFARKHYPLCCTAALNRLIPNYVQSMWMKSADGGIVAALYGPSSFETDIPSGRVAVQETTDYPFAETIRIIIRSAPSSPFALKLRIPGWCAAPAADLNGKPLELRAVRGFASVVRNWHTGDEVMLRLPMRPELASLADRNENGRLRVAVSHGPLLYALMLPESDENTPSAGWVEPALDDRSLEGAEVMRTSLSQDWNWSREAPVRLRVRDGDGNPLELVPYGCAKLRISLFPMATLDPQPRQGRDTWGWWKRCGDKRNAILDQTNGWFDVVFVGDSITHFWETRGKIPYTDIQKEFSVLNLGFAGDRTENVLWRFREAGHLRDYKAKLFMLMIGTNNFGGKPPCTPEQVAAGIAEIVSQIRTVHPASKVLLLPIFPVGPKPHPEGAIAKTNRIIRDLADGRNVLWLDCYDNFIAPDGTVGKDILGDGVHPTEKGYVIWRDAVLPVFRQVCGK